MTSYLQSEGTIDCLLEIDKARTNSGLWWPRVQATISSAHYWQAGQPTSPQ